MIVSKIGVIAFAFALVTMSIGMGAEADIGKERMVRIVVESDSANYAALKGDLNVLYENAAGFSAEVTESTYELLRSTPGVNVREALVRQIQGVFEETTGKPGSGGSSRAATPSDQTPYNVEQIYNSNTITSTSGGAGVKVNVLDTGSIRHIDTTNRIVKCFDAQGSPVKEITCADKNGHGTHVTGTVAADAGSDKLGIYGVASEASVYVTTICSSAGFCYEDDVARAIDYARTGVGAQVVTMSIGGDSGSSLELEAILRANSAGILVLAAAGNDGSAEGSIDWPGAFKEVVAVAAIDATKTVKYWSSRGINDGDGNIEDREVEIAVGGASVESTTKDGKYGTMSGTSMATPGAAGLATKWGGGTSVRGKFKTTAEDITKCEQGGCGAGEDIASGFGLPHVS